MNLAFDEPLVGVPAALPEPLDPPPAPAVRPVPDDGSLDRMAASLSGRRGVLVAGGGIADPEGVALLAAALGWPVLADPRSGCRVPVPSTVAHADAVLRVAQLAGRLVPEVVVRLGAAPASKVLGTWLDGLGNRQVGVHADGLRIDPAGALGEVVAAEPGGWCRALAHRVDAVDPAWLAPWAAAEAAAARAIAAALDVPGPPSEPAVARTVASAAPDGSTLVVSSSMPVRDLEWYAAPRRGLRVLANRGANGIDGVVSTALGAALAAPSEDGPVVALVGDVAMVHDTTSLVGLARREVDLTIVVVDNDGGGIFSFLPQASVVEDHRFEQLFGTPHGTDLAALARAHGLAVHEPVTLGELRDVLSRGGTSVTVVRTDRRANVELHARLHAAIASAVDSAAAASALAMLWRPGSGSSTSTPPVGVVRVNSVPCDVTWILVAVKSLLAAFGEKRQVLREPMMLCQFSQSLLSAFRMAMPSSGRPV